MPQTHKTWIEPIKKTFKTFKGTLYRAKCDCGWESQTQELTFNEAQHLGTSHEEIMKNPDLYRSW